MKILFSLRSSAISFILICLFSLAAFGDTTFTATLDGLQENPVNTSTATGVGTVILNEAETQVTITLYFEGLSSSQTAAHIHSPAPRGTNAGVIQPLPNGNFSQTFPVSAAEVVNLKNGLWYFNVHSNAFPGGEIRGQINVLSTFNSVPFPFSNGSLDATFDGDGAIITQINDNSVAQAVAIQSDGKILVGGFAVSNSNNDFALVRYNTDGTLDNTFGSGGVVITPISASSEEIYALSVQPDGKIVAGGRTSNGFNSDFVIVRYNLNGTLDNTFDGDSGTGNGIVITRVGNGNDIVRSLSLQPNGKIVAVGDSFNGTSTTITVMRFNTDGSLDTAFDGNSGTSDGIIITRIGGGNEHAYDVEIQPDEKIVVAGYFSNGVNNDVALLRYNTNGVLDTSFDGDGIATTAIGTVTDEAFALALQGDGKIVVAGCINSGTGNDFLAIRYNENGSLDTSFGTNGATITPIGDSVEIAMDVAIQPDGKIISAGFSRDGSANNFALVRQNPDGSLDTTFDGDGKLTTQTAMRFFLAMGISLQEDGKIIAVGRAVTETGVGFGVARFGYGTNATTNDGFFNLNSTTAIRFENAFLAGTTAAVSLNSLGLPPLPVGFSFISTPREIHTSAKFSGDVFIKLTLPANISRAIFNSAQVLQFENGAWTDKTTNTPPRDFDTRTIYARISKLSPLAVATSLTQPPSNVLVSGRALSATGRYVSGAVLTYKDSNNQIRYATTNAFGYFHFKDVVVGQPFVIRVVSKRFRFAPQVLTVFEDSADLHFTGQ